MRFDTPVTVTGSGWPGRVLRATTSQGTGFGIFYPTSGLLNLPLRDLSVWIKDNNTFYFYVQVHATNDGNYYIRYQPTNGSPYPSGNYAIVPVGSQYKDGTWHELRRDLDADLRSVFGVGVEHVLRIYIRGDYDLDELTLIGREERFYYYAAGARVAMRVGDGGGGVVYFLHADHLGSTSLATTYSGQEATGSRTLYYPYGEQRWSASGGTLPTDFTYTGQRAESFGLMDYHARYYDPVVGRFISADTIVPEPGNPQDLNRYSHVRNNPLRFVDPSGHFVILPGIALIAVVAGGGAIVNWSFQVSDNHYNQGMSWADAVYHKNLNEGEMVQAAAVAGSVATTAATVGPALVVAGGEALTGAGILAGSSTLYYAGVHTASAGETALAQLWTPYGTTSLGRMTRARNRALSRHARETGEEFTICGGYGESKAGIVGRARAHGIGHEVEVEEMGMPAWRNTGVPQGSDVDLWRPYSPEAEQGIRRIFGFSGRFDYYNEHSVWRHTQPPGSKTYFPDGSMYQSWALWNQEP